MARTLPHPHVRYDMAFGANIGVGEVERMADRIVVLQNGTVAEEGTHEEFVSKSGAYAELFELQAAGYQ